MMPNVSSDPAVIATHKAAYERGKLNERVRNCIYAEIVQHDSVVDVEFERNVLTSAIAFAMLSQFEVREKPS